MGYPRRILRDLHSYVLGKLARLARRRSQRGWQPAADQTAYDYFIRLGLKTL